MKLRKRAYVVHRWLGLVVCLQLLAWSAGGFVFSILPIDSVRGEREIGAPQFDPIAAEALASLPAPVQRAVNDSQNGALGVGSVALVNRGLGPQWEIRDPDGELIVRLSGAAFDTATRLTPEEAAQLALRDFAPEASVRATTLIEIDPPVEYRSGPLPAYQVALDHASAPHIYVHAETGAITARRNARWRAFDFFWMLHTMDYKGRDNFNHLLLTCFSVLAMLTALSGILLWAWRLVSRIKRRSAPVTV